MKETGERVELAFQVFISMDATTIARCDYTEHFFWTGDVFTTLHFRCNLKMAFNKLESYVIGWKDLQVTNTLDYGPIH